MDFWSYVQHSFVGTKISTFPETAKESGGKLSKDIAQSVANGKESLKEKSVRMKSDRKLGMLQLICYFCSGFYAKEIIHLMKSSQLTARLKAAGCSLVRHGGRHDLWYSPITGLTRAVPRHGSQEVAPQLLKTLEKDLLGL